MAIGATIVTRRRLGGGALLATAALARFDAAADERVDPSYFPVWAISGPVEAHAALDERQRALLGEGA